MRKLVTDTNVFISSLIQRSYPYLITTELFSNKNSQLFISNDIFEEYAEVLFREKFTRFPDFTAKAQTLLTKIKNKATSCEPTSKVTLINDLSDNKFLELCETCNADFLITGNTNDFRINNYKGTKIMAPKEYWEKYIAR